MAGKTLREGFTPSRAWRAVCAVAVAGAFILLDRITKAAVLRNLVGADGMATAPVPFIPGVLRLQFVANTGAAFSMGEGMGWVFVALAAAVVAGMAAYLLRAPLCSKVEVAGLAMVAGGAVGNAIDRVVFGYVVDFLATEFIDFPVFNVADIGITCGVVIAFAGFMFLSPANKVDATAELDRRDAERRARRGAGGAKRDGGR